MATVVTPQTTVQRREREPVRRTPVQAFAVVGALLLAVEAYLLLRWITGPQFQSVSPGPSIQPDWMRITLDVGQVVCPIAAGWFIYWFAIRPWRRQRRLTPEGMLCVAMLLTSLYDPLSSYFQVWFTYNANLVNRGWIAAYIPGWISYHAPGASIAWPPLIIPSFYVFGASGIVILTTYLMRAAVRRWPTVSNLRLLGAVWVATFLLCLVAEGLLFVRLGFWTLDGGLPAIFNDHYYRYPWNEALVAANGFTMLCALMYYRNDRGETFVERGIETLRGSTGRRATLQALAFFGGIQLTVLLGYHLPQVFIAGNSVEWPADIQQRSYFNNHLCGDGTGRACPGPGVPIARPESGHLDPDGRFVDGERKDQHLLPLKDTAPAND